MSTVARWRHGAYSTEGSDRLPPWPLPGAYPSWFLICSITVRAINIKHKTTTFQRFLTANYSDTLLCLCLNGLCSWPVRSRCTPSVSPEMSLNGWSRHVSVLFGRKGKLPVRSRRALLTTSCAAGQSLERSPGVLSSDLTTLAEVLSHDTAVRLHSRNHGGCDLLLGAGGGESSWLPGCER